jgi:ABC-type phosphate/phosphonate transport system ATPase subunit
MVIQTNNNKNFKLQIMRWRENVAAMREAQMNEWRKQIAMFIQRGLINTTRRNTNVRKRYCR